MLHIRAKAVVAEMAERPMTVELDGRPTFESQSATSTSAVAAPTKAGLKSIPRALPAGPVGAKLPIAVNSAAYRFPLEGTTPDEMWNVLTNKTDGISEIPLERWDVDAYFNEDAEVPGMMTVRHGAFVKGADLFDASFFGLSPAESKVMDPQQRLLLEVIYQSFHVAGLPLSSLTGMEASICVGQCNNDSELLLRNSSKITMMGILTNQYGSSVIVP